MNLKRVYWIIWKDIMLEIRAKETIGTMLIFTFLVLVIFAFSFLQPGNRVSLEIIPGIIWVTIAFTGMLGLNRAFLPEKNNDCILGLVLAPVEKSTIYLGKVAANFIFLTGVELFSYPLMAVFFNFRIQGPLLYFILVLLLGTIGFSGTGVFLAALSANTRTSEILLPVVLFPIWIPLILGAVKASGLVLAGRLSDPLWAQSFWSWVRLLAVYDLIFLAVSFVLFDYVLEV